MKVLNPEKLSKEVIAKLPEGYRLLESEEERKAFFRKGERVLCAYSKISEVWRTGNMGCFDTWTYATRAPRGWWKEPAKQEKQRKREKLRAIVKDLIAITKRLEEL